MTGVVIGLAISLATTTSTPTAGDSPGVGSVPRRGGDFGQGFGGGSAARGGTTGVVTSVSGNSFTMTTSSGAKLTVDEQSSTVYRNSTGNVGASSIATGDRVLVIGSTTGTTVTATRILVLPSGFSPGA
jgi:Domain of unknown function (DUF5666)